MHRPTYSDKEIALFAELGWPSGLDYEPATSYRSLALDCFCKGLSGPATESVRRCYNALQVGSPKRLTPDFDFLIELTPHHEPSERVHLRLDRSL